MLFYHKMEIVHGWISGWVHGVGVKPGFGDCYSRFNIQKYLQIFPNINFEKNRKNITNSEY
jgi:hypothetical protein